MGANSRTHGDRGLAYSIEVLKEENHRVLRGCKVSTQADYSVVMSTSIGG